MLSKIIRTIKLNNLIKSGDIVLVAVSGGVDSMSLLHLLLPLREQMGFTLLAAHFDHRIRPESTAEAHFVSEVCSQWGVRLHCVSYDVPGHAKHDGISLELAARECRYAFLRGLSSKLDASRIALAHHMDDQAETLLLNIGRGTGLKGAAAMRFENGLYIRPLLNVRKAEIIEYAIEHNIPYCEDASNADTEFTRNHIRSLLRGFEDKQTSFVSNLARFSELAAADDEFLESLAKEKLESLALGDGVDLLRLKLLDYPLASRAIRLLAAKAGLYKDLEKTHIDAILSLEGTGKKLNLPHNFIASLDYDELAINRGSDFAERAVPFADVEALPLVLPGVTSGNGFSILAGMLEPGCAALVNSSDMFFVDGNPAVFEGAVVRMRREGDFIKLPGGTKPLRRIYIDKKIKRANRDLPVIAVDSEILWAVGCAVSVKLRAVSPERVRLQYMPEKN